MGKPVSHKTKLARAQQKTAATSTTAASKQLFVEKIRQCVEQYEYIFVFDLVNSRTSLLKQIRDEFKAEHTFVFGKSKLMQVALGRSREEEYKKNLAQVSQQLDVANRRGKTTVGLLFTNDTEMQQKLDNSSERLGKDFARSGFICPVDVELKTGPITGLPGSMVEHLRELKLPVKLNRGVIELEQDFTVCSEGEALTVEGARILKLFGVKLSEFQIRLLCRWAQKNSEVLQLVGEEEESEVDEMEEEE